MTARNIIFLVVLVVAILGFAFNVRRLVLYLRLGKSEQRTNHGWTRLRNVLLVAFGQSKLLRELIAGLMHLFIFWGFVVLLAAVLESICEGIVSGFSFAFLGPLYGPLLFLEDLFGLIVVVAVLFALYRRYVLRPKRLEGDHVSTVDATIILLLILFIMVTMFGQNAGRIALKEGTATEFRIISSTFSLAFSGVSPNQIEAWSSVFWWLHVLLVLGFLNYLPYSKHLHILSSIPNVYLAKLEPRGRLKPLNLQDETLTKFGASDVEDFSWKQLLDGYSCTECGRCTAACPANLTGKVLSPRKIIVDMRRRLMEKAPFVLAGVQPETIGELEGDGEHPLRRQLINDYITEDELWACTSCLACVQECPVQIEHVDAIVDMRRYLVLNESRFPKELQATFQNLERNFAPWGFNHSTRADWAEGLNVPRLSEKQYAEILFWVGCAGAYDARYKKVTQAFTKLMQIAGIDFAILGIEEKCNGDPARRAGNEYLAQMLMTENIATLNRYGVRKIVTTCPHCFNILKNEYPRFGGDYEVMHHSELLQNLIDSGKIKFTSEQQARIAFHDPCYLGRYNQLYEEPRETLRAIPGTEIVEMRRSRDKSFCCGAGGAMMFMEERTEKRVNIERTEEALALKPNVIGTACPFCMTMLTDGVKEKDTSGTAQVKDIAELVFEAVGEQTLLRES
ncbi:MAG: (Fe-S)-binding protein [Bacteroidota bacterium]